MGEDNHLVHVEQPVPPGLQVRRVNHDLAAQLPIRPLNLLLRRQRTKDDALYLLRPHDRHRHWCRGEYAELARRSSALRSVQPVGLVEVRRDVPIQPDAEGDPVILRCEGAGAGARTRTRS